MLTLLRKVRRKLLPKNKITSFLFYAIGEILLVVIGIMIAVSLDNWNQERKAKASEMAILNELLRTLKNDETSIVEWSIRENESSIRSMNLILDHLTNDKPYVDSLAWHFENAFLWWKGQLDMTAFNRAKEHGLDFIHNNTLRSKLTDLYSTNQQFGEIINRREELYYFNTASPVVTKLFLSTEIASHAGVIREKNIPIDYEKLKANEEYKTIIRTSIGNRMKMILWLQLRKEHMQDIQELITQEIADY